MKKLLLLSPLLFGCSTTNITKLAQQFKDDKAHVHVEIRSIYVTVIFDREMPAAPGTNIETTVKTVTH